MQSTLCTARESHKQNGDVTKEINGVSEAAALSNTYSVFYNLKYVRIIFKS